MRFEFASELGPTIVYYYYRIGAFWDYRTVNISRRFVAVPVC